MIDQQTVTTEDVQNACRQLGIRDWTQLKDSTVELSEARIVRKIVGGEALSVSTEEFKSGLEIELEHGRKYVDANITNNHPVLTGRIVLAHLKEGLDYYL